MPKGETISDSDYLKLYNYIQCLIREFNKLKDETNQAWMDKGDLQRKRIYNEAKLLIDALENLPNIVDLKENYELCYSFYRNHVIVVYENLRKYIFLDNINKATVKQMRFIERYLRNFRRRNIQVKSVTEFEEQVKRLNRKLFPEFKA